MLHKIRQVPLKIFGGYLSLSPRYLRKLLLIMLGPSKEPSLLSVVSALHYLKPCSYL